MAREVADAALFPYAFRPHQRELVSFMRRQLEEGGHAVVESGTGTGKTVCALSAALDVARAAGKRVLYLTRTNSQARQVMLEYRAIRDRAGSVGMAVALQGRAHLCPLRKRDEEMAAADAEELSLMCRDRMKAAEAERDGERGKVAGCPFYADMLARGSQHLEQWVREALPDAEEMRATVEADGQCPHLLTKGLLPDAELVVAPYVYFFHPHLRGALLRWLGAAPSDLIVVVDEAHNLPEYARELATPRLSRSSLALAQKEVRRFGDPNVLPASSLTRFLAVLDGVLTELRDAYVAEQEEDALVPPEEFDVLLLSGLQTSTTGLAKALALMDEYAAAVKQAKRKQGKVPRSYVGSVAAFLAAYRGLDADTHAPIIELRADGEPRLVAFALDPGVVSGVLNDAHATLHLSGTLHPLDEYRDSIGLDARRSRLSRFASPFARENRLVLVDEEVTTRHEDVARDPAMWRVIGERLADLRRATDRNMAVFLPSYDVLHRLAPYLRSTTSYVERRELRHDELMAQVHAFKASRGGTLVSVIGGRLSEGIDFPDGELEVVVIVGLPYARPSAKQEALIRFYDRRFGRGWEWAVKVPMLRKLLQAAGRLIRTPTDRGVVVLLDKRAAAFRDAFGGHVDCVSDPAQETWRFFHLGV